MSGAALGVVTCSRSGCILEVGHDGSCVDNASRVLLSKRSPGYSQPRRTPEAQADIAAARAPWECAVHLPPCRSPEEHRARPECAHAMRQPGCPACDADVALEQAARGTPIDTLDPLRVPEQSGPPIEAVLSNAAIADTPAVREMGGPARGCAHSVFTSGCRACAADPRCCARPMNPMPNGTLWCDTCGTSRVVSLPPGAIVLTGPEAERYRALQTAARKAQESAVAARADGAALLQLFQAFCAGLAPGKEG